MPRWIATALVLFVAACSKPTASTHSPAAAEPKAPAAVEVAPERPAGLQAKVSQTWRFQDWDGKPPRLQALVDNEHITDKLYPASAGAPIRAAVQKNEFLRSDSRLARLEFKPLGLEPPPKKPRRRDHRYALTAQPLLITDKLAEAVGRRDRLLDWSKSKVSVAQLKRHMRLDLPDGFAAKLETEAPDVHKALHDGTELDLFVTDAEHVAWLVISPGRL
jgi:hypothetical protein